MPSNNVSGDVVTHDIDLLFYGYIYEIEHLDGLNVIISYTVTRRENITILPRHRKTPNWFSIDIFAFDLGPFSR